MDFADTSIMSSMMRAWMSGGWLMLPLLALACFVYYYALDLLFRVQLHFLLRCRLHERKPQEIATASTPDLRKARQLLLADAGSMGEVKRHFQEVRNEYLSVINRRIRFLSVIIPAGPLLGLLGTVTGMLSTFDGMLQHSGERFDGVVTGISEALVTTQTGLALAIPALVILSIVVQRRNALAQAIARLERHNAQLALRSGCPIPTRSSGARQLVAL